MAPVSCNPLLGNALARFERGIAGPARRGGPVLAGGRGRTAARSVGQGQPRAWGHGQARPMEEQRLKSGEALPGFGDCDGSVLNSKLMRSGTVQLRR